MEALVLSSDDVRSDHVEQRANDKFAVFPAQVTDLLVELTYYRL